MIFFTTDIDECSAETNPCDENADCTNIDGSFSCTCKEGFTGDGKTCQGVFFNFLVYDLYSKEDHHGKRIITQDKINYIN